jgi:hypothetical protein
MMTKGVRNTIDVVASMNNPHIDDDFYRFLVQYLAETHELNGLKYGSELFKTLDVVLFEITLPEMTETKNYRDMITLMEQFYAGMQSIGPGINKEKNYFTMELALSNNSNQIVFYVCVPRDMADLFEKYVGEILKTKKYTVSFTKTSGDLGVDIVATKNSTKIAVQLKRYTNTVGRAAISDAVAGMAYYKCTSAMVITSNYFTKSAQELAKANKCELVDRDLLSEWIVEFQKQK